MPENEELAMLPKETALKRKEQLDEAVKAGNKPEYETPNYAEYRKYMDQIYYSLALQEKQGKEDGTEATPALTPEEEAERNEQAEGNYGNGDDGNEEGGPRGEGNGESPDEEKERQGS